LHRSDLVPDPRQHLVERIGRMLLEPEALRERDKSRPMLAEGARDG